MPRPSKTTIAQITLLLLLVAGIAYILPNYVFKSFRTPPFYVAIRDAKQIKLVLDSFAMDNDGAYPERETAEFYEFPPPSSSNDYFRQLIVSGNLNSERLFWVRKSAVCSPQRPDDVVTKDGEFSPEESLQPGDNHWAYFPELENTHGPSRPLLIDSYLPGTTTFDKELWDNKVIILRIDGSAKLERPNRAGTILDGDGQNLLSKASKVWDGATSTLRQPDPVP